ncbi:GNAT family protein [Patulibacter brassicae]|jgi:RimJ/RimL family protein N-acetyltransferase|uniref:GNAT family protein n=1 Tax=Patulibacter brassicae TaxID=1705717 RepID=A0ABU4VKQ8_9ACTN|nr:GNAT family protein [Patulibacter brassicae]MDX8152422.1 GNAT family protein [Patulibacter brassicae]
MDDDARLGARIDWTPATPPDGRTLVGRDVRLERLDPAAHGDALWAAQAGDPALWDYLPYGPFPDRPAFDVQLGELAATEDPLLHAVIRDGRATGCLALMSVVPEHGRIEIGHVWFGAPLQRTRAATEAVHLLATEAFARGFRRLEWKCNALNRRSWAAAERFGFTYEGTFRQHMVVQGRTRDTAWFSIGDDEWPAVDAAFRTWLDPASFDDAGRQRRSLRELQPTRAAGATR